MTDFPRLDSADAKISAALGRALGEISVALFFPNRSGPARVDDSPRHLKLPSGLHLKCELTTLKMAELAGIPCIPCRIIGRVRGETVLEVLADVSEDGSLISAIVKHSHGEWFLGLFDYCFEHRIGTAAMDTFHRIFDAVEGGPDDKL